MGSQAAHEHVVDAWRIVRLQCQDRPAAIRHELLPDARKQPADVDPCVLGAVVLGRIIDTEREQVGDLAALGIDHADTVAGADADAASLAGGDVDGLGGIGLHVCWFSLRLIFAAP